jgi:hypothetical protein
MESRYHAAFLLTKRKTEMNPTLDRAKAIAYDVRNWAQERAERAKYHANDLMGWCAIASAELHKRLKVNGIASEIHVHIGDIGHVFLVVEDHVLDVTATQFGLSEVFLMHHKKAEAQYCFYTTVQTFTSAEQLRKQQLKDRWPASQLAYA